MKKIVGGMILGFALLAGTAVADTPARKPAPPPAKKVAVVDINHASQQELEAIPEIGTDYCHHIMMGRPYETTQQLVERGILPQETYDKVKTRLVAKADTKPAPKK